MKTGVEGRKFRERSRFSENGHLDRGLLFSVTVLPYQDQWLRAGKKLKSRKRPRVLHNEKLIILIVALSRNYYLTPIALS